MSNRDLIILLLTVAAVVIICIAWWREARHDRKQREVRERVRRVNEAQRRSKADRGTISVRVNREIQRGEAVKQSDIVETYEVRPGYYEPIPLMVVVEAPAPTPDPPNCDPSPSYDCGSSSYDSGSSGFDGGSSCGGGGGGDF